MGTDRCSRSTALNAQCFAVALAGELAFGTTSTKFSSFAGIVRNPTIVLACPVDLPAGHCARVRLLSSSSRSLRMLLPKTRMRESESLAPPETCTVISAASTS